MLKLFDAELEICNKRLLKDVPKRASVERETLEHLVTAAFHGGALAGISKAIGIATTQDQSGEFENAIRGILQD